jgi:hypothetical protein
VRYQGRYLWEEWANIKRAIRRIEQYGLCGAEDDGTLSTFDMCSMKIARVVVLCAVDQLAHSVRPDVCPPENPYQYVLLLIVVCTLSAYEHKSTIVRDTD